MLFLEFVLGVIAIFLLVKFLPALVVLVMIAIPVALIIGIALLVSKFSPALAVIMILTLIFLIFRKK